MVSHIINPTTSSSANYEKLTMIPFKQYPGPRGFSIFFLSLLEMIEQLNHLNRDKKIEKPLGPGYSSKVIYM